MTDQVRQNIIAVATALFSEKGFAKVSMNDIVRASGLSKGGVYWHFTSKDEIITAIVDQFFEVQLAVMGEIVAQKEPSATEKLRLLAQMGGVDMEAMATQFPSSMEFYVLAARDETLRNTMIRYFNLYRDNIQGLVDQGIRDGEWEAVDAKATADTVIALFEGVLLVWSLMPEAFRVSEQLNAAINILLMGLKRRE